MNSDINEKNETLARYHVKEIDKSLINALEKKMNLLGREAEDIELIKRYKNLLAEYRRKLGMGY